MRPAVLPGVEYVRELCAAFERGEVPTAPLRDRFIAAIRRVEREGGDGLSLDAALGLSQRQWNEDRRRRRNEILRQAQAQFLPDLSLREAGKRLARLGREVQSGRIRSKDGLIDAVREVLATGAPFPGSGRQVENILAGRAK